MSLHLTARHVNHLWLWISGHHCLDDQEHGAPPRTRLSCRCAFDLFTFSAGTQADWHRWPYPPVLPERLLEMRGACKWALLASHQVACSCEPKSNHFPQELVCLIVDSPKKKNPTWFILHPLFPPPPPAFCLWFPSLSLEDVSFFFCPNWTKQLWQSLCSRKGH